MTPFIIEGRRPRISFLNNQGLASTGGGATILRRLVSDLASDCDVTVLSHDPAISGFQTVRQVTLARPPAAERFWRLAPVLRARHLKKCMQKVELGRADLVVVLDCHFAHALRRQRPSRMLYLSLSCIPRQEWFGTAGFQRILSFVQYALLERAVARRADAVLASSEMHAGELRRFEAMRRLAPVVLPPMFSTEAFDCVSTDIPAILCAGRLERVKNYAAVIEIAARLRDLPCRFLIAGDGPLAAELRQQAVAADLSDRITFCGSVRDLGPLLAQARLFLHPSRYESFGIAVFEAMQAGVPPVVARLSPAGYHEILNAGVDSMHVDFGDPDRAAQAIRLLLLDDARRETMGVAARMAAARALTRDYLSTFRGLLESMVGNPVSQSGASENGLPKVGRPSIVSDCSAISS